MLSKLSLSLVFVTIASLLQTTTAAAPSHCRLTVCTDYDSEVKTILEGGAPFCSDCSEAWRTIGCNSPTVCTSKTVKDGCKGGHGTEVQITGTHPLECSELTSGNWNLAGEPNPSQSKGVKAEVVA